MKQQIRYLLARLLSHGVQKKPALKQWFPRSIRWKLLLADAYIARSQFRDARGMIEEALTLNPVHPGTHSRAYQLAQQLGEVDAWESWVEQLSEDHPFSDVPFYQRGVHFRKKKEWDQARLLLERAYELSAGSDKAAKVLKRTYYDLRDVESLLRLGWDWPSPFLEKDEYLFLYRHSTSRGRKEWLLPLMERAARDWPDSLELQLLWVDTLVRADRVEEGGRFLERIRHRFPDRKEVERKQALVESIHYSRELADALLHEGMEAFQSKLGEVRQQLPHQVGEVLAETARLFADRRDVDEEAAASFFALLEKEGVERLLRREVELMWRIRRRETHRVVEELEDWLHMAPSDEEGKVRQAGTLKEAAAFLLEEKRYLYALACLERLERDYPHALEPAELHRDMGLCRRELGRVEEALASVEEEHRLRPTTGTQRKRAILQDEVELARSPLQIPDAGGSKGTPVSGRVLHVLNNTLPYTSNGYAIRSQAILRFQKERGFRPVVATRLGFPEGKSHETGVLREAVDGLLAYRLVDADHRLRFTPIHTYLKRYAEALERVVEEVRPEAIHAASNFFNGYPAAVAARSHGIPFIYEVRGFWEMTRAAAVEGYDGSAKYESHRRMEREVIHAADQVVVIGETLKEYLMDEGVSADKITVVPNGVDTRQFEPLPPDLELAAQWGLEGKRVIGFIGSITPYEGLDDLIQAFARLSDERDDLRLLIVGGGRELPRLKEWASRLQVRDRVIFTGRVAHSEVPRYYSLVDLCPFPRMGASVCELIPPLKPLEAMALAKTVLVSDLPALREMVRDGETGIVFRSGDVDALTDALAQALHAPGEAGRMGRHAREWVLQNRDWRDVVIRYRQVYDRVMTAPV
ncbi:glycosyltransferase [Desmospora profundinema]|uniref:PEP-CTERM/exosortase A-associated glycosyltransferase n=1 Tax=Desmospora profundinema TaxID=1571184 RepID=A0ABU1IQE7_9BACL|nr:glycosyltransferase [Desmospora profundinema]MDR6227026.1 PEP-CTERM/exosortase A-associated glycosyltransferase [Desmospora profundinema]